MASIALSIIGCIDYLAYGTIFTRAMFLPKKNLMFFSLPEKPQGGGGVIRTKKSAPEQKSAPGGKRALPGAKKSAPGST
jgi:hypothetical protein